MATVTGYPYSSTPPRIEVLVQGATSARLTVRRLADGQAPAVVRGAINLVVTNPLAVVDYEAPLGVPVQYQVEEFSALGASLGFSTSAPVTLDVEGTFLHQPLYPERCVRVLHLDASLIEHQVSFAGDHARPGLRKLGVWFGRGRGGTRATLEFATETQTDHDILISMFGVGDEQVPPVLCLRTTDPVRLPMPFYLLAAEPGYKGFDWHHDGQTTIWRWSVEQTTPPAPSIVVPGYTYEDLEAYYAAMAGTYSTLAADHSTYSDVERRYDLTGYAG